MKTYKVTRAFKSWAEKTVTVPDDTHEDDVVEMAWDSSEPWVTVDTDSMGCEVEEV